MSFIPWNYMPVFWFFKVFEPRLVWCNVVRAPSIQNPTSMNVIRWSDKNLCAFVTLFFHNWGFPLFDYLLSFLLFLLFTVVFYNVSILMTFKTLQHIRSPLMFISRLSFPFLYGLSLATKPSPSSEVNILVSICLLLSVVSTSSMLSRQKLSKTRAVNSESS